MSFLLVSSVLLTLFIPCHADLQRRSVAQTSEEISHKSPNCSPCIYDWHSLPGRGGQGGTEHVKWTPFSFAAPGQGGEATCPAKGRDGVFGTILEVQSVQSDEQGQCNALPLVRRQPIVPTAGKAKGKAKTAPELAETHTWVPPAPPWRPATEGKGTASTDGDSRVQELLGAIRGAFGSQQLPSAVAEAMARIEDDSGKALTKTLHNQTSQLGAAKKQLQEARQGRKAQEAAWVDFLNQTVQSLETGAKQYQVIMAKLDEKETEAAAKVATARRAIRDLTAGDKSAKEEEVESDDSEVEMMADVVNVGAASTEDNPVLQAQKKLKVTLDALLQKMPAIEDSTPRRRGRAERPAPTAGDGPPAEVRLAEDGWPYHAILRHSIVDEYDYLSPRAARIDALLWQECVARQGMHGQADDLARQRGSLTFLHRWTGCWLAEAEDARSVDLVDPEPGSPSNRLSCPSAPWPMGRTARFDERQTLDLEEGNEDRRDLRPRVHSAVHSSANCTGDFRRREGFLRMPRTFVGHMEESLTSSFHAPSLGHDVPSFRPRVTFAAWECEIHEFSETEDQDDSPTVCQEVAPTSEVCLNAQGQEAAIASAQQGKSPRKPSLFAYMMADQVHLLPPCLTGPLPTTPASELTAVFSGPQEEGDHRYTIFEPRLHVLTRRAGKGWTPIDYVADAAAAVGYPVTPVRYAQFLLTAIPGFPSPQVVLTPASADRLHRSLPLDLRAHSGHVCTLTVAVGDLPISFIHRALTLDCEGADEAHAHLREGTRLMFDAAGQIVDVFRHPLETYEWVGLRTIPAVDENGDRQLQDETALMQMPGSLLTFRDQTQHLSTTPCCRKGGTMSDPAANPGILYGTPPVYQPAFLGCRMNGLESDQASDLWLQQGQSSPTQPTHPCCRKGGSLSDPAADHWPVYGIPPAYQPALPRCRKGGSVSDPAAGPHALDLASHSDCWKDGFSSAPEANGGNPTYRPTGPDNDPEPVLTPPAIADILEPTIVQKLKADEVEYEPAFLRDRRVFGQPVANFLWGFMTQGNHGTYTVFDRLRHVTIEKCQWHVDFESLAALAIARAPFAVKSIQLLTKPIEGLPKPQIVIAELGRPHGELPIPWDLRAIDMQIRTVRHMSGQDTGEAIRHLQESLPPNTDLEGLWRNGHLHVSDALGPVESSLPTSLTDIQFFRIQRISFPAMRGHVMNVPRYVGGTGARESTGRFLSASTSGGLVDEIIARLLAQHEEIKPFRAETTLTLARAFPPGLGYLQEVLLCISDDPARPCYIWDARGIDGALTAQQTEAEFLPSEFVVPADWRNQGWTAAINGVPVPHVQRTVVNGDFYQPYLGMRQPPSVPQGRVVDLVPALGTFTWPFPLSHFQRMYLPRLRDRRWRLGANFVAAPGHLIYGPEHGVIRIHVAAGSHLSHEELVSYIRRLDRTPHWGSLTPTSLNLENIAVFVSEARNSGLRTVLSPAPFFPDHFLILLVSQQARVLRGVPLAVDGALFPRQRFGQGDVLDPSHGFPRPLPDSSDLDNDEDMPTQVYPATPSVAVPITDRARPETPRSEDEQPETTALLQLGHGTLHETTRPPIPLLSVPRPVGCNTLAQGPTGSNKVSSLLSSNTHTAGQEKTALIGSSP
ncbi:unnamed protein product [Symbiodinium microadriaticum]|nr:unnamed protein product [Symbiodinium microadriaticum]